MDRPPLMSLHSNLRSVTDRRQTAKVLHKLEDLLFIAVVATIANAGCWEEIADFGAGHVDWFRRFIELPNGAPSHDTFERAFKWIDGKEFERVFILWMKEICHSGEFRIIALDGKTMRGSGDKQTGTKPLHVVSAWTSENNMVLGQVKTEEKSNEITAIPQLLELLDIQGAVVTIDAMGTQKQIAEMIVSKKADYVLSVKGNQQTMLEDIRAYFEEGLKTDFKDMAYESCMTIEKGHGRIEKREYILCNDIDWIDWRKAWKKLSGIGMVRRSITKNGQTSQEIAYFITSLPKNAEMFGKAVRGHWGVESMHWSLDVVLNEDKRIVRKDNGARNLAVLKRMALNIIQADMKFEKASGTRKRFRASWDSQYLEEVLQNM